MIEQEKSPFKIFKLLRQFNYISAKKFLESNPLQKELPLDVNIFSNSYILMKLGRLYESYLELEKCSNYAKQHENNLLFIISEYNRRVVGRKITWYYNWQEYIENNYGKLEFSRIDKSVKQININNLIENYLTSDERKLIKKKLDNSIINELKDKALKLSDSVDQCTIFMSGIELNHRNLYQDFTLNYIFIDNVPEFNNLYYHFIKIMLEDARNIQKRKNNENAIGLFEHEKLQEQQFEYLDIYLMIERIKPKDLLSLFNLSDLKAINLINEDNDGETIKIILESYNNLINSILELDLLACNTVDGEKYLDYVSNFLIIFTKLTLDKDDINNVLDRYAKILDRYHVYYRQEDLIKYLTEFIINMFNNEVKRQNLDYYVLGQIFIIIYNKTINNLEKNPFLKNIVIRFIKNCSYILFELKKSFVLENIEIPDICSEEFIIELYIPMYKILKTDLQEVLKYKILHFLENKFSFELYYAALLHDIIEPNSDFEKLCILEIENKVKLYYNLENNPIIETIGDKSYKRIPTRERDEIKNCLNMIADLINYGKFTTEKICNHSILNGTTFENKYLEFVCNMSNFDYNKFDVSYVHYLTKAKLDELQLLINSNNNVRSIIKEKFLNALEIGTINRDYMKNKFLYLLFNEPYR